MIHLLHILKFDFRTVIFRLVHICRGIFSKEMAQSEQVKDMLAEGLVTGPWDKEKTILKCSFCTSCAQYKNNAPNLF